MSVVVSLDPALSPLQALAAFRHLARPSLLYSSTAEHSLGRYSYLSADPVAIVTGSGAAWPELRERLRSAIDSDVPDDPTIPPFQGGWLGWFSYELGSAFDRMPRAANDPFAVSDISFGLHDWVIAWDHLEERCLLVSTGIDTDGIADAARALARADEVRRLLDAPPEPEWAEPSPVDALSIPPGLAADFAPAEYRDAVARVVSSILAGDIFQANLTQRFTAPFRGDAMRLLAALQQLAPAPMGACIAADGIELFSASPELFLRFDARTRAAETRPIKGTRPRSADPSRDSALAAELVASAKDRAENVMIVDLLRNDFSRVCDPGSVVVGDLCRLESHRTVHHLVSTVSGRLRPGLDALDLLAATYPGGSITGAPKLRAMAILAELERVQRGIYCGAIGWLGLDGSMELNLAIRSIVVKDGMAAVHAGGGVTAQSQPDSEYRESLDKARALIAALAAAS